MGEIVASLNERVQQGQLQAGDKLPSESEIMAQFEVSRTVVREALSRLQAAGAVETRHGIGTFVLPARDPLNFSLGSVDLAMVSDVIALLELRISLETEAAGLAAQRRTDARTQAPRSGPWQSAPCGDIAFSSQYNGIVGSSGDLSF